MSYTSSAVLGCADHVFSICTDLQRYHRVETLTLKVELHPIWYRIIEYKSHERVTKKNQHNTTLYPMSASNSKVVTNHGGHLSSSYTPILFLGFLFFETDFEERISDDLFQSSSNLGVQHFKVGKFVSSIESTISTSLIHNIAPEGKSEQVVIWFLIFLSE